MADLFYLRTVKRFSRSLNAKKRVPVLQQLNMVECGAACLAMVLSYYGRKTKVSEVRELCHVGRDGLSAQTILKAARSYGLRAKAYSVDDLDNLHNVSLPAIAHWNFNHFVVVEQYSPKQMIIVDPAIGRRQISREEFNKSFTGVILTFTPGKHFPIDSAPTAFSMRHYLWQMLSLDKVQSSLAQVLLVSLLLQGIVLLVPIFTKIIVDYVLPSQNLEIVTVLALCLATLILARLVTGHIRASLLIFLQGRLDTNLMLSFYEQVLSLPFRYFQQRSSGDILLRLASNRQIRDVLTNQTLSIMLDSSFAIFYLLILFQQEFTFGALVLTLGLVQVLSLVVSSRRLQQLIQKQLVAQAESESYLINSLVGISTLKACGAEDQALDHWTDLFFKELNLTLQQRRISDTVDIFIDTVRTFSPLILLLFGAYFVLNNLMSLGTLLALTALATSFLTPLSSLVYAGRQIHLVKAHFERIADVLNEAPEQMNLTERKLYTLKGTIALDNLSFRYSPDSPEILKNVSITIGEGQKVAIVGRTGSGKSTLALLLLGLYEPTYGKILFDNLSLTDLNYRALRNQFGVVLQDPFLINGSIRQNIALNKPDMPLQKIMRAAQLANIDEEIRQMPLGYETPVAEGGTTLSGGQRQRLAIARAVAHDPKILLLDEATSHLDATTESQIHHALKELTCTRIVIAHRLSTVVDADQIIVLHNGQVVELGNHTQLLAKKGHYAELFSQQTKVIKPSNNIQLTMVGEY